MLSVIALTRGAPVKASINKAFQNELARGG
jgi:hypothetical protein